MKLPPLLLSLLPHFLPLGGIMAVCALLLALYLASELLATLLLLGGMAAVYTLLPGRLLPMKQRRSSLEDAVPRM